MSAGLFALLPHILFTTRSTALPHAGDPLSVMPFLALARELAALLIPLQPRPQFRADLERSLVAAAQQQKARMTLAGAEPLALVERDGADRRWVIGAAAAAVGSAVSVAGIVTYVWWHRRERAA